jgi:hypothetical protein
MAVTVFNNPKPGSYVISDHVSSDKEISKILSVLKEWCDNAEVFNGDKEFYEKNINPICLNLKMFLFSKIKTDKTIEQLTLAQIFEKLKICSFSLEVHIDERDDEFLKNIFEEIGFLSFEEELKKNRIEIDVNLKKQLFAFSKNISSQDITHDMYNLIVSRKYIRKQYTIMTVCQNDDLKAIALYKLKDKILELKFLASDPKDIFEKKDIKPLKGPGRIIIEKFVETAFKEDRDIKVFALKNIDSFYGHMGFEKYAKYKGKYIGDMILTKEKAYQLYIKLKEPKAA